MYRRTPRSSNRSCKQMRMMHTRRWTFLRTDQHTAQLGIDPSIAYMVSRFEHRRSRLHTVRLLGTPERSPCMCHWMFLHTQPHIAPEDKQQSTSGRHRSKFPHTLTHTGRWDILMSIDCTSLSRHPDNLSHIDHGDKLLSRENSSR